MLIISLYLIIGYAHAKSRMRKGLVPLGYHRVSLRPASLSPFLGM